MICYNFCIPHTVYLLSVNPSMFKTSEGKNEQSITPLLFPHDCEETDEGHFSLVTFLSKDQLFQSFVCAVHVCCTTVDGSRTFKLLKMK